MIGVERLPVEIRESDRAVVWRYELRHGQWTKPPYQPRRPSLRAKINDPATWGTLAESLTAIERGEADGVGIMLGGRLAGVDLDHVRDPCTGVIADEAMAIVDALNSYTEVSPSDTGLHVLCRGVLPPGRRRRGDVELYDGGRFFTLTGRHLAGTPRTLEERMAQLAALHRQLFDGVTSPRSGPPPAGAVRVGGDDQALLARAHRARNGTKFAALWRGDASGYASRSEADLAFCSMLAFWAGADVPRMDRLFRASGLMRPKWDARRGARTYGAQTIERALAGRG